MVCAQCGYDLPDDARFCPRCGAPSAASTAAEEERKVVTILFCDLVGSTALSELLDPEPLRALLLRYYAVMEAQVHAHGGVVEKFIGDAVMAVFGLSATREDDAYRALIVASGMIDAVDQLNRDITHHDAVPLRVRIGVHTGPVVTTGNKNVRQALVSGDVVNVAARLEQAAGASEILMSSDTLHAAGAHLVVESAGELTLKGISTPFQALRLVAVSPSAYQSTRRFDVVFIGRDRELDALDVSWRHVIEEGQTEVVTVLGEAGVGKTRLVTEWLARHAGGYEIAGVGQCHTFPPGGSLQALADSFTPIADHAQRIAGDDVLDQAIAILRNGLLHDGTPGPSDNEVNDALATVLHGVTRHRPAVIVIDDCHWAGPALLEFLDGLMESVGELPIMFLCLARPELMDVFPTWGMGRTNAMTITVGGLPANDAALLAANLIGVSPHQVGTTERIVEQAAGNPFYLEQLAATVAEDDGSRDRLPLTLYALIAARIDRLNSDERRILRHAAVLNSTFDADGIAVLIGETPATSDLRSAVRRLVRRQFLDVVGESFGESATYRFSNVLTQRVVYEGLTKRRRGEMHERFAEHLSAGDAPDHAIAAHLDLACRLYDEVDLSGAPSRVALRAAAVARLAAAGSSALRRLDLPRARPLLERALSLASADSPLRPECLRQLGEILLLVGLPTEAEDVLTSAVVVAEAADMAATAMHARLHLATATGDDSMVMAVVGRGRPVFARADDDLGLARCDLIIAGLHQRHGRHGEAMAVLDIALRHSLAAEADRELANTLGAIGLSLWHGTEPAASAICRCNTLLAEHGEARRPIQATLGFALTVLYAIGGHPEQAVVRCEETRQAMSVLSHIEAKIFGPFLSAMVADAAGDPLTAVTGLREAHAAASDAGALRLARDIGYRLARLYAIRGDRADAGALLDDPGAEADGPIERANAMGIRSRLTAPTRPDDAVRLARNAVKILEWVESPGARAQAQLDLAYATMADRDVAGASAAGQSAIDLFTAKGHVVGVANAMIFRDRLAMSLA